jgi:integrase
LKSTTKIRLINDLKAALNGAYLAHRQKLPSELPVTIKHGLCVMVDAENQGWDIARDNQILTDDQVGRLIGSARSVDEKRGWEGDLFRMVVVLAATGARFSQIAKLRVADVQPAAGRIIIPVSLKGRGKKGPGIPFPVGPDIIEALHPAIHERPQDAFLLERWRWKQATGEMRWERAGRGPWQSSSELSRPWALIREDAHMPSVIPYALRHSSIIRGLRSSLPTRLVAALHDTSVVMIERHYGRYIADGLDELAARSVVALVPSTSAHLV